MKNYANTLGKAASFFDAQAYHRWIDGVLLGGLMLFAFVVRVAYAGRGLPYLHHWDEPEIAFNALNIIRTGDFNPYFFNYGSLTIYLNVVVDGLYRLFVRFLPPTSPAYFSSWADVRYGSSMTDFQWYLSHPAILFWNRTLTTALGALTIGVVYHLALRVAGRLAAVAGAVLLGSTLFHIEHSAYVTTDVPMAFFAACVMLCVFVYLETERVRFWLLALVFCGMATAVKYNAGLVVLLPAAALWMKRDTDAYRLWWWLLVGIVPSIAFFISMPYALLDFPNFFSAVQYEIFHYSVQGHGKDTIEPGLTHMRFQAGQLRESFGLLALGFAGFGLIFSGRKQYGWWLAAYGLLYFLLVSQTRVSFHRNLLVVYPVLALLFGLGVQGGTRFLWKQKVWGRGVALVVLVGIALVLGQYSTRALRVGWGMWNRVETRSQAVLAVNAQFDTSFFPTVGIASELRLHPIDVARLDGAYLVAPALELLETPDTYDALILPMRMIGSDGETRSQAETINDVLKKVPATETHLITGAPMYFKLFTRDPGVMILFGDND